VLEDLLHLLEAHRALVLMALGDKPTRGRAEKAVGEIGASTDMIRKDEGLA
jgi:hypothetical protein